MRGFLVPCSAAHPLRDKAVPSGPPSAHLSGQVLRIRPRISYSRAAYEPLAHHMGHNEGDVPWRTSRVSAIRRASETFNQGLYHGSMTG